jgi:hypothetical protein
MACVTLKRSLDFDPLHSPNRSTKRARRCGPPTLHQQRPAAQQQQQQQATHASVFRESTLTPEQIANNLRDEIKRLKKRRQIPSECPCEGWDFGGYGLDQYGMIVIVFLNHLNE